VSPFLNYLRGFYFTSQYSPKKPLTVTPRSASDEESQSLEEGVALLQLHPKKPKARWKTCNIFLLRYYFVEVINETIKV